jgi:hypothetical protein
LFLPIKKGQTAGLPSDKEFLGLSVNLLTFYGLNGEKRFLRDTHVLVYRFLV